MLLTAPFRPVAVGGKTVTMDKPGTSLNLNDLLTTDDHMHAFASLSKTPGTDGPYSAKSIWRDAGISNISSMYSETDLSHALPSMIPLHGS
jgi:hypothetical protein